MLTPAQLYGFLKSDNDRTSDAASDAIQRTEDTLKRTHALLAKQAQQTETFHFLSLVATAFLPFSFCTSVYFFPSSIWVFSDKRSYQYFGMDTIMDWHKNPLTLSSFWVSTLLLWGLILLVIATVGLWKRPWGVRVRSKIREIFSRSSFMPYIMEKWSRSDGRRTDIESPASPAPGSRGRADNPAQASYGARPTGVSHHPSPT